MVNQIDTTKTSLEQGWDASITEPLKQQNLFTLRRKNTQYGRFIDEISTSKELRGTPLNRDGLSNAIKKIVESRVVDYATSNLEKEYEEFHDLVKRVSRWHIAFQSRGSRSMGQNEVRFCVSKSLLRHNINGFDASGYV
jgi:hypothetical protein